MLRRLLTRLRGIPAGLHQQRKEQYQRTRQRAAFTPVSTTVYGELLRQIRASERIETPDFCSGDGGRSGKARMYLRHDVDTARCVEHLPLLLDINIRERVTSPVFIRTDAVEYDPAALADPVHDYRRQGVQFGLHSSCYVNDDYLAAFAQETAAFERVFGFRPRVFTVHGLGEHRFDIRERFVRDIIPLLDHYGYQFTDAGGALRQYDYVIEDCNLDAASGKRFIYEDFLRLPRFLAGGKDYLVLTHPCYWTT